MKKLSKQGLIVSQKMLSLAKQQSAELAVEPVLPGEQQYQYVVPRVFPNAKIPTKVAIHRKIKQFASVDLNELLPHIQWYQNSHELSLCKYMFSCEYVIEYGCTQHNIENGKVKARAYSTTTKRYQKFHVQQFNKQLMTFSGTFQYLMDSTAKLIKKQWQENVPRAKVCLDFEDPTRYISQVSQAVKRRQKVLDIIKYQFYVDNLDLEQAQFPAHKMLNRVKELAMQYVVMDGVGVGLQDVERVVDRYRRVMNQLMFRKEVVEEQLPIYLPTKYKKRVQENIIQRKKLKVKKDNKIMYLVPKPLSQKLQDLQTRSIFLNANIPSILLYLKQKLHLKPKSTLFQPLKECIIQKYLIQQQRSFDYCFSSINQYIVDPLASYIRALVKEQPDGWFRMYEENRSSYLDSKLRRVFVLANNMIRDWLVGELADWLKEYLAFLSMHTPEKVVIDGLYDNKVWMKDNTYGKVKDHMQDKVYVNIIVVEMVIEKGTLKLSHDSSRLKFLLRRLISLGVQKFTRIPSAQPIALKQLFGGYKNQQGIKLQLPTLSTLQLPQIYPQLTDTFQQLLSQIDTLCQPLLQYQKCIIGTASKIRLSQLLSGVMKNANSMADIVAGLRELSQIEENVRKDMEGIGGSIGFWFVNYEIVKNAVLDMIRSQRQTGRRKLLIQNKRLSTIYYQHIRELQRKLLHKPRNLHQMLQKQSLLKNLPQILLQPNRPQLFEIQQTCEQYGCRINPQDLQMQIQTNKIINQLYRYEDSVEKEFQNMKKDQLKIIQNGKRDVEERLVLLKITKNMMAGLVDVHSYEEYAGKVRYMMGHLGELKAKAEEMRQKESMLQVEGTLGQVIKELAEFQQQLQPYQLLWASVEKWKVLSSIWLKQPIGSYQLKQPQITLQNLKTNLKKASYLFSQLNHPQLQKIAQQTRRQIQQFQPKLQLLRLLKKRGLSRKHLQQIDIHLPKQIENMSLEQALSYGLFDKITQIQAISNDAWNQFSLEQTLDRLIKQIHELKFVVSYYQDRKKNNIYIIVNYKVLIEGVDSVLSNLQAVQFNPMVKMFQAQIKQLYDKSLYISNSLNICEQFQKVLVQLHPIFDSTDIVKQIPAENKKFSKVLRIWLQLTSYIKSILSVHDSCSSQNIYQKIKSILTIIEEVKRQLITYLQQKRKGFSRFYLLSNSEMFQLFSATSDIGYVNNLIMKLFDTVTRLDVSKEESKIVGVLGGRGCGLAFIRTINYKGVNIENWLSMLQKQIKISISQKICKAIQDGAQGFNWGKMIDDTNSLPQIIYLLYQLHITTELSKGNQNLPKLKQSQTKLLQMLITKRKSPNDPPPPIAPQPKSKPKNTSSIPQFIVSYPCLALTEKSQQVLCSMIILISSKLDIISKLTKKNSNYLEQFEWKKLLKVKYVKQSQKFNKCVVIQSLNYVCSYGCEFLGVFARLVVTNLTEKMQIVYLLAQMYSLGAAAVGPAGTGKSQTTKDIAKILGKTCLIYNCSQNFHQSTFLRLIKGLAITGLWMCFDEFNRLDYKILSIAAEQLSYILRFRGYGHRIELSFMGDSIWLQPSFQFCITYNVNYQGRRTIPKSLNELFRTIALVLPDQSAICQALLYSCGFSTGQRLSKILINVLKLCRKVWQKQQTYDFGLRALRSIISMSSTLLQEAKQSEEDSIIEALKVLNTPKMKSEDRKLFLKILQDQFKKTVFALQSKNNKFSAKLSVFYEILNVRDGILLCGQPLSGKEMVIQQFKKQIKQWQINVIFHDVLTVDELYGQLDATTKLWKDGFFTKLVRENVGLGDKRNKCMIVLNGSVYSEWVQNLNSFLDGTRKLSLSSGQTISIPNTLKLVIQCTDLQKASPATITRFGVINYEPLKCSQLVKKVQNFPKKLLTFFQELQQQIRLQYLGSISSRFILNWVLDCLSDNAVINFDTFIFYLAIIYEGLLTHNGKAKFDKICRAYLSVPYSPFQLVIKMNGQPAQISAQFIKFKNYQETNDRFSNLVQLSFQQIFVQTLRSYKLTNIINTFIVKNRQKKHPKILTIIGDENIGKSRISKQYLNSLQKQKNKTLQIFFTRNTNCKIFYEEISQNLTRKSSNKLGGDPGVQINIWVEDVNMPTANKFSIIQTAQLLRLICSQGQWYNYTTLTKQILQDIIFITDAKNTHFSYKYPLNMNPRLYKYIEPIFCKSIQRQEIQNIFTQIVRKKILNQNHQNGGYSYGQEIVEKYCSVVKVGIQYFWQFRKSEVYEKNGVMFNLNDMYRATKGLLAWRLPEDIQTASEIYQFQISRNLLSKIYSKSIKVEHHQHLQQFFSKHFSLHTTISPDSPKFPLFHNLQNSNISTVKCQKIENMIQFTNHFQCLCEDYRTITHQPHSIIVFPEMIQFLLKIYRTLSLDYSHICIAGLSKCGKNTMIKLVSYLISTQFFMVRETSDNVMKNWQETVKSSSKLCYKSRNSSLLVLKDKYLAYNWFTQDLNKMLNTMNLPHLYSEADIQQMIYMMQSQLVRKNLPTTKQSMWQQLIAFLKQKMHIVLLVNPTFTTVKSTLIQYPSILQRCNFIYLDKWPKQALYLIAKLEMPDFGYTLDLLPQVHQYSQKLCENSKLSILDTIWEGMYFDFIGFFYQIYQQNQQQLTKRKNQYEQSQKVIEQTQDQLQKTKNKIKKLQPTIIMIQNETAKTVRNLQTQRKNAQQTNKALQIKNEEFEKIIKQSRVIKAQLEHKVSLVDIQIAKAWQNVSLLKPTHISEVKALANPSQFIKTVLSAVVILTYDGPLSKQVKDVNGHVTVEQSYFETAKKYILSKDAKAIGRLLTQFKRQYVTKQMFLKLQQKCLSYKRWGQKQAKSANKAIYFFFLWVEAVANQYRIYEETQPLREQLQKISTILEKKQIELTTIKKQLQFYQTKIIQFEEQHKIKKQSLQEYRLQILKFERMLTRGHELLKQIAGEKQKWVQYIEEINEKIKHNFGDSVVMAATIVYMSPHVYELRKKIKQHISKLCRKRNIPCTVTGLKSCEIPWYISRQDQQIYHSYQIHENEYLIDNIKISQHSKRVILLVDPQEQGIKLMKKLSWQNLQAPIDRLSEYSNNLVRLIQSAILYGRIVFIEIDGQVYNSLLKFIIDPVYVVEGEQKCIKSGDKNIPVHDKYRLYLYTTVYPYGSKGNKSSNYSMQLLANLQIINFKMTFEQLQQRILQIIINTELPMLKAKIQQMYRINTKDIITLNSIQQKLLVMFSSQLSAEQILESDEIINTVVHSNRLYKQISIRIKESKAQSQQIQHQKKPFLKKTQQICLIYENIQRLKLVSNLYAYSYHWFLDLFEGNVYNFHLTLYQQVSKALRKDQKIVVAILIAQIVHPNLPWKCLFNVEQSKLSKTIYTTNQQQQCPQNTSQLKQSQINFFEDVMKKLGNTIKQLPVSQSSWNSIMSRITQVNKYLPTLQSNFEEQPQIFVNLVTLNEESIFDGIPDQYSHLDFFYRILLISCFRPECVIQLLKEWIKINLGPGYIETTPSLSALAMNSRPYRPIIAILPDTTLQSLQSIRQIYKQSNPSPQSNSSTSIVSNFHFLTTSQQQLSSFDALIKSSIVQNAWVIIESVNRIEVLSYIKQYFEEIVVLPERGFRLWVIVVEGVDQGIFGERFCQFCDKVRITNRKDLYKEINSSFWRYQQVLVKENDFFERNKKKMMISQLCILHQLLSQFSDRYTQLSQIQSQSLYIHTQPPQLLTLTQYDLKLLIEQMCYYKIEEFSKQILSTQLIPKFTYGSQICIYYLQKLLEVNAVQIVNGIVTERGLFWQLLWCDEKFPKDSDQYEHEVKGVIKKKKYMDMFGLDSKLLYKIKVNQYEMICKFYQRTVFHQAKGISLLLLDKLQALKSDLTQIQQSQSAHKLASSLQPLSLKSSTSLLYHFIRLEYSTFQSNLQLMKKDINNSILYLSQSKQIQKKSALQSFMLNIYAGMAPWSKSHRPYSIAKYCEDLKNAIQEMNNIAIKFDYITNFLRGSLMQNFGLAIEAYKKIWGIAENDNKKCKLVFIALDKISQSNIMEQLKFCGFEMPQVKDQYPQQIIHNDYGQKLDLQTIFKKFLQPKINILNCTKAKQKGILGYVLLKDLNLLNSEVQLIKNHLSLKVQIPVEEQQTIVMDLMKSLLNFSQSGKNIGNAGLKNTTSIVRTGKNQSGLKLHERKVQGILLFVESQEQNWLKKSKRVQKILQQIEDEKHRLIPIPCYEYSLRDITKDSKPVSILYTLATAGEEDKIEEQIIRKNIHFSLKT